MSAARSRDLSPAYVESVRENLSPDERGVLDYLLRVAEWETGPRKRARPEWPHLHGVYSGKTILATFQRRSWLDHRNKLTPTGREVAKAVSR